MVTSASPAAHRTGPANLHGHARPNTSYARRNPEAGVLYRVLQQHLATFLSDAVQAEDGAGLPKFVDKELRAFLKCGVLAHGFSRFRCSDCKFERLVPLSCKGRGFCPSCGGKRMTDIASHLTDHVVPFVPVRQFVMSFPYWLRYRLAYDHARCAAVIKIFMRAVLGFYRRRAREHGVNGGRNGSVTFVQRFGSAANLNLHAHAIVLDGVFVEPRTVSCSFTAPRRRPTPTSPRCSRRSANASCAISNGTDSCTMNKPIPSATNHRCSRAATRPRSPTARRSAAALVRAWIVSAISNPRAPRIAHRCKLTSIASTCTPA